MSKELKAAAEAYRDDDFEHNPEALIELQDIRNTPTKERRMLVDEIKAIMDEYFQKNQEELDRLLKAFVKDSK